MGVDVDYKKNQCENVYSPKALTSLVVQIFLWDELSCVGGELGIRTAKDRVETPTPVPLRARRESIQPLSS